MSARLRRRRAQRADRERERGGGALDRRLEPRVRRRSKITTAPRPRGVNGHARQSPCRYAASHSRDKLNKPDAANELKYRDP